jgi:hypothetical protein
LPDYVAWGLPVIALVGGALLAAWTLKRFTLRLTGTILAVSGGAVLALVGWWLSVGLAFALFDRPIGDAAPWWATPLVEGAFMVACASAAFAVALTILSVGRAIAARRG